MAHVYASRLNPDEVRLLQPVSASQHGLFFRLITTPRRLARQYTAVSYTWGSDQPTESIFLDDKPFSVRPNLWACLYHLVNFPTTKGLCLWVDAICINQGDDIEKASQVRLMDETYRDADHVSVWLGLLPLGPRGTELKPSNRQNATLRVDDFDWYDHMADLTSRPYWKRFWVIQEFLLGREVMIYCGNTGMHWQQFQTLLCTTGDIDQYPSDDRDSDWATHHYDATPLIMGRHPDKHPETHQPLETLLVRHSNSLCQDPRDRIFALLGLIDPFEKRLLERFFPNYTLSEEEVLILTVSYLTQSSAGFEGHLTADSDDLFLALKVKSKAKREEILRKARTIDFPGTESVEEARRQMDLSASASDQPPHLPADFPLDVEACQAIVAMCQQVVNQGYGTFNHDGVADEIWIDEYGQFRRRRRGWWSSGKVVVLGLTFAACFWIWRKWK
ncbi:heterokaryon incompatibility protein-domain-containing protein [Plectosphaerella cucumerina]|uniref:Heterokaryon incompatibility protein-domain-containing protein n=1 Tax=Plectosphaerella cucumerina TaxID=40658 RepID=A0A8K0TPC5_9PEZI|nr:heterokaryon incompatibility protein-domain-containing protein [Plectosphaerella cucumerina]